MYLYSKLESLNKDIQIAFIGCGKFISMFLSQYNQLKKIKIKQNKIAKIAVFQIK